MMGRGHALALSVILAGCSLVNDPGAHQRGDGGDGTDAGPALVQASEFCGALAELMCSAFYGCCSTAPARTDTAFAQCVSDASSSCAANEVSRLLTDPRTGYDAAVAAQVLAEGRAIASACGNDILDWYTERSGFQRALTGTVSAGASCTPRDRPVGDFDFAALFSCEDSACVAVTDRSWSCLDRQPVGGNCVLYWDCVDGLRCDSLFVGARGTCQPRLANTTPCTSALDCESLFCDTICRTPTQDEIYCSAELPAGML